MGNNSKGGIGNRINELMFRLKKNQSTFGQSIGYSQQTVRNVINEITKPRYEFVEAILNAYPTISKDWLLDGEGDMFLKAENGRMDVDVLTSNSDGGTMFEALKDQYEKRIDELTRYVTNLEYTVNLQRKMLGNFNDPITAKTGVIPMWSEDDLFELHSHKLALG